MQVLKVIGHMLRAMVVVAFMAGQAVACAFHGYTPDPTVVDYMLGSEHIVVAKPDPNNPSRFQVVEALVGPDNGIDIPLAVSDTARRDMANNPDAVILLARDGAYGPWLELATLDREYRKVINTVASRLETWRWGEDLERFQTFAKHVNSNSTALRRLALLELDRADYSLLRQVRLPRIPTLAADIATGEPDLLPIRVLLAGLSKDRSMVPILTDGLAQAVADDVPYVGAFATAMMQLQGGKAGQGIVDQVLGNGTVPKETQERVIEAFAIQSQTGNRRMERSVYAQMAQALQKDPSLAAPVARQFGARGDWGLADAIQVAAAASPPVTVEAVFSISQYLGIAKNAN